MWKLTTGTVRVANAIASLFVDEAWASFPRVDAWGTRLDEHSMG